MPRERYECNGGFFHEIRSEVTAYWLGFVAADGNVNEEDGLEVNLALKDKDHLLAFQRALHSTHPIKPRITHANGKPYPSVRIAIHRREIVRDLIAHGVTPRKSLTFTGPIGVPDELYRHFVRGYSDGNGGFSLGHARFQWYFTSTLTFCQKVERLILAECDISPLRLMDHHNGVTFSIFHTGPKAHRIGRFLYDNAETFLARKKEKLETYERQQAVARTSPASKLSTTIPIRLD